MTPTTQRIDVSNYTAAMRDMSRRSGISLPDVLEYEAKKVLETSAARTPMMKKGAVGNSAAHGSRQYANKNSDNTYVTHAGVIFVKVPGRRWLKAGQVNPKTNAGKIDRYAHARPIGRSLAARAQNFKKQLRVQSKENKAARLKARGLAVQSWIHAARAIGIALTPTAKISAAANARATNGVAYRNGGGSKVFRKGDRRITIVNTLPYNTKIGMGGILNGVVRGREKFFKANLRKGVFDDMRQVAAKYPGMRALQ